MVSLEENFLEALTQVKGEPTKLYPYQKKILEDKSTKRIVNKAKQVGISWLFAAETLVECLWKPAITCLFISNSQRNANRILQYVYDLIYSMPLDFRPDLSEGESKNEVRFMNRSKIISLANNPSTARGYSSNLVYVDELAHFNSPSGKEMVDAVRSSISRGGRLTLFSTPYGTNNEFYRIWSDSSDFTKFEIPWYDCPDPIYRAYVKTEKTSVSMDPLIFDQEYLCKFLGDEIAYFPHDLVLSCINNDFQLWGDYETSRTKNSLFAGIDFGRVRSSTVITVIEQVGKKLFVRLIKEFSQEDYTHQLRYINGLDSRMNIFKFAVDQTGIGIRLYEELRNSIGEKVQPVVFTPQSKERMVTNLKIAMEESSLILPDHEKLKNQFQTFQRITTPGGTVRYKHQEGKLDDMVWSLALAVDAASMKEVKDLIFFGVA